MRRAAFELLDELNKIDKKSLPEALAAAIQQYPRLPDVLYYGLSDDVVFDLPEGEPPYKASNEINTHSLFWSEIRRLYLFTTVKELNKGKRQQLFIEMLEFVHPSDATLIIAMKDRKWPFANITPSLVKKVCGNLLDAKIFPDGSRG